MAYARNLLTMGLDLIFYIVGDCLVYVVCYVVCIVLQIRDVLLSYVYRFVSVCCDCVHLGLYIVINVEGNQVVCHA